MEKYKKANFKLHLLRLSLQKNELNTLCLKQLWILGQVIAHSDHIFPSVAVPGSHLHKQSAKARNTDGPTWGMLRVQT